MASTPNDFFSGMKESIAAAKAKVGSMYGRVTSTLRGGSAQTGTVAPDTSGMRGSADVQPRMSTAAELAPEAKVGAAETLPGNDPKVVERLKAATAQPMASASPAVAGEGTAAPSGGAKQPGLPGSSGGIRNPSVQPPDAPSIGPGRPSPEAQAFKASRAASAGGTAPNPAAAASGGGTGEFPPAAPRGAVSGGGIPPNKPPTGMGMGLRTPPKFPGLGLVSGILSAGYAVNEALPGGGFGAATGYGGAEAAPGAPTDGLRGLGLGGARLEPGTVNPAGAPPVIAPPGGGANTAIPGGEQAKAAGAPQNSGGGIPTLRGASVSPESLMAGNDVPQTGYGAFKRSTPMKAEGGMMEQPAVGIHAPAGEADEAANARHASGLGAPARPGRSSGVGGAIADLYTAGAQGRSAALNRDFQLKAGSQRIAMMQLQNKLQQEGRERNNALIDNQAAANTEPQGSMEGNDAYKNRVAQRGAMLKNRFVYSASQRNDGLNFGDMGDKHIQQLHDLNKVKEAVDHDDSAQKWARDFFGVKQFKSENLYSYAPKIKEVNTIPGRGMVVTLDNNNKISQTKMQDGSFNWFSPNAPVDLDINRLMNQSIEEYQAKKGRK